MNLKITIPDGIEPELDCGRYEGDELQSMIVRLGGLDIELPFALYEALAHRLADDLGIVEDALKAAADPDEDEEEEDGDEDEARAA